MMKIFDCRVLMIPLCFGLYLGLAYVGFFEFFRCLLFIIFGGEDYCEEEFVDFGTPQVKLNLANFYFGLIFNIIGIIFNAILIAGVWRKNHRLLVPALFFSFADMLKCAAMSIAYGVIFRGALMLVIYIPGIV